MTTDKIKNLTDMVADSVEEVCLWGFVAKLQSSDVINSVAQCIRVDNGRSSAIDLAEDICDMIASKMA